MCGICGKLNLDRQAAVDEESLRRMMVAMKHRGPDGDGVYVSVAVGLGHVRLAIIDLDFGAQPIAILSVQIGLES
jgi:asparagine synthase (glutamine-hydrolysing)